MYRTSNSTQLVYQADHQGVEALDPLTGLNVWAWSTGVGVMEVGVGRAQLLVDVDLVLHVADYADTMAPSTFLGGVPHFKGVVALDALTGALRWQVSLGRLPLVQVQMVATREVVVVKSPGLYNAAGAVGGQSTIGLSRADGSILWTRSSGRDLLAVEGMTSMPDRR